MPRYSKRGSALTLAVALALAGISGADAANGRLKANNATNLDQAGSWTNGIPTPLTLVQFNSTYTLSNELTLGSDLSWMGIEVLNPTNNIVINGTNAGTGGTNTLTLGRAGINLSTAPVTADLTINANLALLANTNQIWSVADGRTLTINTPTFTRQGGASINVTLAGTGSVAVSQGITNDSTGIIGTWATFGTGTNTTYAAVTGGKIVAYAGSSTVAPAAATDTTGTANYTVNAAGTLAAGAAPNTLRYTGAAGTLAGNFQANGLLNSGGALVVSGNVNIGASRELVVNASGSTITMSGVISDNAAGSSALTKTGANNLTLTAANTYTGITTVSAGSLILANSNALGTTDGETIVIGQDGANATTPPIPAIPGGVLRLTNNINVPERLTLMGLGNNTGFLVNNDSGTNILSGLVTLSGTEAVRIGVSSGSQLTFTGGIVGTGSFMVLNPMVNSTLAFTTTPINMGSSGRFYQDTGGIVALGVAGNTFTTTTIANGTMRMDIANAIPSNSTVAIGLSYSPNGTFDLNGFDQSISTLSSGTSIPGTRTVTSSGGTPAKLTINQASSNSYNGLISGNLSLTKTGTGTLTLLNGDNTFTGDTVISQGTMQVNNYAASTAQNGTVAVTNTTTATVTVSSTAGLVAGQPVTGTGIPANSYISGISGNTITITTPSSATAGSIIDFKTGALAGSLKGSTVNYDNQGGTLTFGNSTTTYTFGGLKGAQNLSLINAGSAPVAMSVGANGQSTAYTGVLSGTGASLNKIGTGALELRGANTYTGGTTVTSGRLIVSGSLANAAGVNVSGGISGGTLGSGHNTTSSVGAVTVASDDNGGGTLAPGDTGGTGLATIGKLTVNGTLTLGTASTASPAHLALELGGTTGGTLYDQVATTGNVSLNNVSLDLSFVNGFGSAVQVNDTFLVILNGGSGAITGTFANAAGNQIIASGVTFSVNYTFNSDGTANDVALTVTNVAAVPEPSAGFSLLLGASALVGLGRIRARRQARLV